MLAELTGHSTELARIGGWQLDLRTLEYVWSHQSYRILDVDPPNAPSPLDTINLYHPEAREIVKAAGIAAATHGTPWDLELPARTAKGREIWVHTQGTAVVEDGKVVKLLGTFQDITNRRVTEHALIESESRTQRLLRAASVGLWDWDFATGRVYFSPEWLKQLGYEVGGLPEHYDSWVSHLHPDDREAAIAHAIAFRDGRIATYDTEFRMRHRDGSYRWILARADIARDADGKPLRMMGSHFDISERKEVEAALRVSEEQLKHALEATRDGLWDWSIATGDVYFSPQWARLLGYEPGEVPRSTDFFFSCVHPDDLDRIKQRVADHLAGLTPTKQDEVRLRMRCGTYRWFLDRGKVVERDANGTPLRMVGTITDIAERKRAEDDRARLESQLRQAHKMESVGRLAGGVAHDFNNMLGVILGHTESALAEVPGDAPLHDDLVGIREAATRSADITRQLLAFARQQNVVPEIIDLNDRVAGMLKLLPRLLGEDIRLTSVSDANLWPIRIDPSQVDQILTNLCVNARKAIANVGLIEITTANRVLDTEFCDAHLGAIPGEYVCLTVRDTGCGISEDVLPHIFEPFYTTGETGESVGLGLATVFGAVSQNNGFVDVTSSPGAGATFAVYLPRYTGQTAAPDSAATTRTVGGTETILLVEDEPALLRITSKMLESRGFTVLRANGPEEAMRIAESHVGPIDLLLTDVIMPGMNGRDLVRRVQRVRPSLRYLYMSGYPADVIATHGVMEPGVHFIQKPFLIAQLSARVRAAMDQN